MSWEVIDKFIQMAASVEEQPTDTLCMSPAPLPPPIDFMGAADGLLAVGQAVCRDFLKLINGALDIESLGRVKAPDLNDVLENEGLTPEQKLQAITKKYSLIVEESESLRAKVKELEKNLSKSNGETTESKTTSEDSQATNEKLAEVMKELTTLREAKELLEIKLKETEKALGVRALASIASLKALTDPHTCQKPPSLHPHSSLLRKQHQALATARLHRQLRVHALLNLLFGRGGVSTARHMAMLFSHAYIP